MYISNLGKSYVQMYPSVLHVHFSHQSFITQNLQALMLTHSHDFWLKSKKL